MSPEAILAAPTRRERTRRVLAYFNRLRTESPRPSNLYRTISDETGLTYNQVAADCRDARKDESNQGGTITAPDAPKQEPGVYPAWTNESNTAVRFRERVYTEVEPEEYAIERFTGALSLSGDWVIVGDVHLPYTDWDFAETMLEVAKAQNMRNLLIAGDWVNMDAFSRYDAIVPPVPLSVELLASERLGRRYAAWFDTMILLLGNHEARLMRFTKGEINGTALGRLLLATEGKLRVSPYAYCTIESGGHLWRITHPANYSKLKGRVGDELAQKYQCSVVVCHQHHSGMILDRYGRYTVIDNGGLHDSDKMAYVKLVDSTSVAMTKGFTLLINGTGHLITPYPTFTDLSYWLTPQSQERAA